MGWLVNGRCWATSADAKQAFEALSPVVDFGAMSWLTSVSVDGTGRVFYTLVRRSSGTASYNLIDQLPACTGGETWPGTVAGGGGGGTVGVEELQFTASVLVGGFLFLAFVLGIMAGWRRGVAG